MKNHEIYYLIENLEKAMKPITGRLLKMDIARDLVKLRAEKLALDITFDSYKTEESEALNAKFLELLTAEMRRIKSAQEADLKLKFPEMLDTDIANKLSIYQISEEAEVAVKASWPDYSKLITLQNSIAKQRNELMRAESKFELTAVIKESDLPENDELLPFESVAVLAYFFDKKG